MRHFAKHVILSEAYRHAQATPREAAGIYRRESSVESREPEAENDAALILWLSTLDA